MVDDDMPAFGGGFYAEQDALAEVVKSLHALLPSDGVRVEHDGLYIKAESHSQTVVYTTSGEEQSDFPWAQTMPIKRGCEELRRVMYRPGVGSWWSLSVVVQASGQAQTKFNYDDEPEVGLPPAPISYLTDLQTYPVDEQNRPEWLKQRVLDGIADLRKYGRKSYPDWLKQQIEAGSTPEWLQKRR